MPQKRAKHNATGNVNANAKSDKTHDPEELLEKAKVYGRVRSIPLNGLCELYPTRKVEYRDKTKALGLNDMRAAEAVVAQLVGTLAISACDRCTRKCGNFTECIVTAGYFDGACANCHFGHVASRCSLQRRGNKSNQKGPLKRPRSDDDAEESVPERNILVEIGQRTGPKKQRLNDEPVENAKDTEHGASWYLLTPNSPTPNSLTPNSVTEINTPYPQEYVQEGGDSIYRLFTGPRTLSHGMFNPASVTDEVGQIYQSGPAPFVETSNGISNEVTWQQPLPDRTVEIEDRPNSPLAQPQLPSFEMSNIGSFDEEDDWLRNQRVPDSWYDLENEFTRDWSLHRYPTPPASSPFENINAYTTSQSSRSVLSWRLGWLEIERGFEDDQGSIDLSF